MARRALGPKTLAATQAVAAVLSPTDTSLLVACSGGADSLALVVAALAAGRPRSLPVAAIICDHGLQPNSAAVAKEARDRVSALGCGDVEVITLTVRQGPEGPEAAARAARYAALEQAATKRQATVLLGHTLDDQAETVLLGLARGSGTRSLAGMAVRNGRLVRPFLSLRHDVTMAVCAEVGIGFWRDPHNEDRRYRRPRVRSEILPLLETQLGPGIAEALARTALLARDDADLLDRLATEADPGTETLSCAQLSGLPAAVRRRVLRRWLVRGGAEEVTSGALLDVDDLITAWRGQRPRDLPGVSVGRQDGRLWCRRRNEE